MLRWIYSHLIRLHPHSFRQRFGEEMVSIFDESTRQHSGLRLVMDAFLSMLRQWVLRSEYWSRPERTVLAGGTMASLDALHRRSEQLQKKAHRMNLVWVIGAFPIQLVVAAFANPATKTVGAEFFFTVFPVCLFLALYRILGRASLGSIGGTPRSELEGKLERLLMWAEYMGPILISTMLVFASIGLLGPLLGKAPVGYRWLWVHLLLFGIQTIIFFTVLRRLNQRAASALQEEIDVVNGLRQD